MITSNAHQQFHPILPRIEHTFPDADFGYAEKIEKTAPCQTSDSALGERSTKTLSLARVQEFIYFLPKQF